MISCPTISLSPFKLGSVSLFNDRCTSSSLIAGMQSSFARVIWVYGRNFLFWSTLFFCSKVLLKSGPLKTKSSCVRSLALV